MELPRPRSPHTSLYIHVPFCAYRCQYCDFYFETTENPGIHQTYVKRLLDTARETRDTHQLQSLKTLYLGGGTPSALGPQLLDQVLGTLHQLWPTAIQEISLEVNPEHMDETLLKVLEAQGVHRISLGVQTLEDQILRDLDRRAWKSESLKALELLAQKWTGSWNLDIMTGLPGQTPAKLDQDLHALLAFQPPHVSLYSLTLEPQTPLDRRHRQGTLDLPSPDQAEDLWLRAKETLEARGLAWYEISNFARPGHESRHNQGAWRLDPYWGLGPGAQGTWPRGSQWVRTAQPKLFDWLAQTPPEEEILSPQAFFLEHLLTGLRTAEGLSWDRITQRFGLDLQTAWSGLWPQLSERGWCAPNPGLQDTWVLTAQGRLALNRVLDFLLPKIDDLSLANSGL